MKTRKTSRIIGSAGYAILLSLIALLMVQCNLESAEKEKEETAPVKNEAEVKAEPDATQMEVLTVVDEMPKFPGGDHELMRFISKNIKYPQAAQDEGKEGRVICAFIVKDDGTICDVKVVRSLDPALDAEAVRVLGTMPIWIPGKQNGKAVNVKYTVPITFKLK